MKGTKLLLSFWLSTAAFCLLQILFGPGGLGETARLLEQKARLEVRLEALKTDNLRLTARYEALRTSEAEIRLEARALGWFQRGEIPIRTLEGSEFRLPSDEAEFSAVPRLVKDDADLTVFFRLAWPVLFATFYALFYLAGKLWPPREQWESVLSTARNALPPPLQTGLDFFRK